MEDTKPTHETNEILIQSLSSVLHDMQQSVSSEVSSIRQQNEQVKALLIDAVATLHDAFSSIHDVSQQYTQVVQSALDEQALDHHKASPFQQEAFCTQLSTLQAQQHKHLGAAVRALQFEDIAMQNLTHTDKHLNRMEGVLKVIEEGLQDLDNPKCDMAIYTKQISNIHAAMMIYQQTFQLEGHSPVSQESMDEGDIELF